MRLALAGSAIRATAGPNGRCAPWCKRCLRINTATPTLAVSPVDGRLDSLILPQVNGQCMQLFIDEIAARYPTENIVMILDGAGWHKTAFELPENLKLQILPPYSPELNPQEHLWDELREKYFHNKVFDSLDALEDQLADGLRALEFDPETIKSISAWDWIINAASNEK